MNKKRFSIEEIHIYGSSLESIVKFGLLLLSFLICILLVDKSKTSLSSLAGAYFLFYAPLGVDYCIRARNQSEKYIINKVILSIVFLLLIIADAVSIAAMGYENSNLIMGLFIFAIFVILLNGVDAFIFFVSDYPESVKPNESRIGEEELNAFREKMKVASPKE